MDFIWQFACSWLWGMLSNSLSGSSPTSAHEVKLAQSKFGQFWMDKQFGVELMDILKPVASRGTSLSERNALLLSSPSLGGSRIAARIKALPLPQSGPRLDLGKTNIGGGHEDRSLKRPRQADRQLDNRNDSADKVSADNKEAGSSNDDVLASTFGHQVENEVTNLRVDGACARGARFFQLMPQLRPRRRLCWRQGCGHYRRSNSSASA